jgi:hypothetical protein
MADSFFNKVSNPINFKLFLLAKLPMAWLAGIKLHRVLENECVSTLKFSYLTQNPFRSIYFACLSMAAEMATGVLVMGHVTKSGKKMGMLVNNFHASFIKKAVGRIYFTCNDGQKIEEAVQHAILSTEKTNMLTFVTAKNAENEIVATFEIDWSVKLLK